MSAMTSRLSRLEARQRRGDEVLLVWRKPGASVTSAVAGANFVPGDRVICAEWFGGGPLPAPAWHGKRLSMALGSPEYEYITKSLNRVVGKEPRRDPGFAPVPPIASHRLREMSDNDLLHATLGLRWRPRESGV